MLTAIAQQQAIGALTTAVSRLAGIDATPSGTPALISWALVHGLVVLARDGARRWRLHRRIGSNLADIARQINPVVRGWMQYYGAFYRSALKPLLSRINSYLMRWLRSKYKRLRPTKKATACWQRVTSQYPRLFAHWAWVRGSGWSG